MEDRGKVGEGEKTGKEWTGKGIKKGERCKTGTEKNRLGVNNQSLGTLHCHDSKLYALIMLRLPVEGLHASAGNSGLD